MAGFIVSLLAASTLSAPVLGENIAEVDVAVVTGSGTGVYEVFVAPDGWVEDCRTLRSDYSAGNNARVCDALLELKARKPASGPDGKPIHAVAVVARSDMGAAPIQADIVVEVASLPASAKGRKAVDLEVLVDDGGRLSQCQPDGTADAFSRVACEQAAGLRFAAREDRHGQAVPYLARVRVDFVQGEASS